MTPDLSRLALCNPNDSSGRAEAAAQKVMATIRIVVEQATKAANKAWRPPPLMDMPVFPPSSVPVYILLRARFVRR